MFTLIAFGLIISVINGLGNLGSLPSCEYGCNIPVSNTDNYFKVKGQINSLCVGKDGTSQSQFIISANDVQGNVILAIAGEKADIFFNIATNGAVLFGKSNEVAIPSDIPDTLTSDVGSVTPQSGNVVINAVITIDHVRGTSEILIKYNDETIQKNIEGIIVKHGKRLIVSIAGDSLRVKRFSVVPTLCDIDGNKFVNKRRLQFTPPPTSSPTPICDKTCITSALPCASIYADNTCYERIGSGCDFGQKDCLPSEAPPDSNPDPTKSPSEEPTLKPTTTCEKTCITSALPCASIYADNTCYERIGSGCEFGQIDCLPSEAPPDTNPDPTKSPSEEPTPQPTTTCQKSCITSALPCASIYADNTCYERIGSGCDFGQIDCLPAEAPPDSNPDPTKSPSEEPTLKPTTTCEKTCVTSALPCASIFADNTCYERVGSGCDSGQVDCLPGEAPPQTNPDPTKSPSEEPTPQPTTTCQKSCVTSALPCASIFADNTCYERIGSGCDFGQVDCLPSEAPPDSNPEPSKSPSEEPTVSPTTVCNKCADSPSGFVCASIYLDNNCYLPLSTGCDFGTIDCSASPAKSMNKLNTIENVFINNKEYITVGFIIGLSFAAILMCTGMLICKIGATCCKRRHKYKTIGVDDSEVTAQSEFTTDVHVNEN